MGAQEKSHLSIDQVEQEIAVYTKKKIDSYILSPKEILRLRTNIMDEIVHFGGEFDDKKFELSIIEYKTYKLRIDFFLKFPEKKIVYESSILNDNLRQACTNGGFESGAPTSIYTFRHAINPNTGISTNIVTTGSNFVPIAVSGTLNNNNSFLTLVSSGTDPLVPVPRVLNGNRAIKLNASAAPQSTTGYNVTTMSRSFVVNESSFNYNYSLILQNPGHPANSQPFFVVRLYDINNNIIRQSSVVSNIHDCLFINAGTPGNPLLYTGWVCDQIDTSDLMGQTVRVEFIIADCLPSAHFGTVYIDDICNTNCANPISGSVNLAPIPTIICPTTSQTICGTYTLPQQSMLNSITLNVLQGTTIVGTLTTPTTLTSGSFCFEVPLTAFGVNPNGNFEFQAVANFTRICTIQGNFPLNPITDNSANDTGPDVVITNCIDAVNDSFTTSTCTMGSFSVLNNDTVYSNPATVSNTIITQTSPVIPQLTLNSSTGLVTVNSGSSPGIYTLNYQICNANNPFHCDTASVQVLVNAPQLEAISDDLSSQVINACTGGVTSTVFVNDVYCGIPVTSSSVSVTLQNNGGIVGAGINSNGIISVPLNTPVGNYTLTYQICLNSNPSICDTTTVTISVVSGALPIFDFITTICNGTDAPILPLISNNGISGTWSPSVINNTASGTYTFTPNGNCALPVTVTVTILEECGLFLEWGSDVSCQLADGEDPRIKIDSDIADGPCIRVCENSTILYELTGDVSSISYTEWNITGGTFTSTATTCTINWDTNASFSAIQAIVHLTDGSVLLVNRCIEKLNAPLALFGIMPDNTLPEVTVCENTEVAFDNLTIANNGHDDIYYNWSFGDGATSNAFEPTHVYTHSGVYEVTLTAFNGCSCIGKYSIKVIVERGITPIECPSVVCENDRTTYAIPKEYGESCEIKWEVLGGEIVDNNTNNTSIAVIWNQVDENGFGYVTVGSEPCFKCTTTVKVPVVQNQGTIKGVNLLCEKAQGLYALPQWPTTDFTWTLDDAGTGATLIQTNQRNEIVVQAGLAGTITLSCSYFNTLLGCGGTATYEIKVTPSLTVDGDEIVCKNATHSYSLNFNGNNVSAVNWQITGPNNFSQNGTSSPLSITFPSVGIYNITITDPNYCLRNFFQIQVLDVPQMPATINGPLTVCPGIPVTYSCIVPNGATANWEVTNGTIIGNNTGSQIMVNFDPLATSPYEVKLSFLVDDCYSDVLTTIINRDTPIIAFNVVEPLVCGSSYATYAINAIDVDNYEWTIFPASAGSVQSGQNSNQVYILWNQTPQTGVQVKVTVRKCGAEFSETTLVDIINSPAITISGPTEACTGNPVTFNFAFTGSGFTNVLWDFGDGTTATSTTSNTVNHTYNEPIQTSTTFTVTATVYGANGCLMPATTTHQVAVSPSPVVTLSPTVNLNLCDPSNIPADYTYTVNLQGGFSPTDTVQWFKNGNATGVTTPTIDVSLPGLGVGTYYAVVTNVFNCTANTSTFRVNNNCINSCNPTETIEGTATNVGCDGISVEITSVTGTPSEIFISYSPNLNGYITSITTNQVTASGLNPGEYSFTLYAEYPNGCFAKKNISFIIPYKAGIKHNITCATSGGYNVQLLDYSIYYPDTPPTSFEFTTNNGATWQTGTVVGGIAQLTTNLAPGSYIIGIRIQGGAYPSCTYFEPLVLPNYPVATFTHDPFACQNNAMQFYADDDTVGLQYFWEFPFDASSNLQQDPVKTFSSSGFYDVTLTVTNKYGCSASFTTTVVVVPNNMDGKLEVTPENACLGSSMEISYDAYSSTDPIQTLYWYHNNYTAVPFAVTHAPNLDLTVTQSGQYFVYAQNTDGCMEYGNIRPISVAFVPAPQSPLVKGPTSICSNNSINLTVPVNSTLEYEWTLNGIPMPTWNNFTTINYWPTAVGNYVFTVTASVITSGGISACVSLPTTYVVTVLDTPNVPELIITQVQCEPYKVTVSVSNPQGGVSYYWSNGDTGTTAIVTHDGPLQVRAEANGCGVTAQMDLPVDLDALAWIFPDGCFSICEREETGYIIGPLGEFEGWKWLENGGGVLSGSGGVSPLTSLSTPNSYELYVYNGYCNATYGTTSFTAVACKACEIRFEIGKPKCVKINGVYVYEVPMTFVNSMGVPLTITISAPNGEGYFTSSTHNLPNGSSSVTSYFYPMNGFTGGVVSFVVEGTSEKGECFTKFDLEFPNCDFAPRMSEVAVDVVLVAPNPTKDFTTLLYEMQNKGAVTIEIADPMGRTIWNKTFDATRGKVVIDCSVYAAGYYPVLIKQNGVVVAHTKLIVQ
jgi:PKD repeat protein